MPLSIADALNLETLRRGDPQVATGGDRLDVQIRWLHISEQVDAANDLKGGELLFTTGMNLTTATAQRAFVRDLAAAGVAGLVVRLGGAWAELPDPVRLEAEAAGLPLIVLKNRVPFGDVMREAHDVLVADQVRLLRKAEELRSGFTDLVLLGSPVEEILEHLAGLTGAQVILENVAHQIVAYAGGDLPGPDWNRHSRRGHDEPGDARKPWVGPGRADDGCTWLPIMLRGHAWGRLHVLRQGRDFDEIDLMAVDRAALGVGLSIMVEQAQQVSQDHIGGSLISSLMDDRPASPEDFLSRARGLGTDFATTGRVAALAFRHGPVDRPGQPVGKNPSALPAFGAALRSLRAALDAEQVPQLCGVHAGMLLALVGVAGSDRPRLTRLAGRLREFLGPHWVVGVSQDLPTGLVRAAALQAVESAAMPAGPDRDPVRHFADLGLEPLLLGHTSDPDLAAYVEAELGPLLARDAASEQPLLPTLREFLAQNGRVSPTARRLGIDRRVLAHRIATLDRILDTRLADYETRLRLSVAVDALGLLGTKPPAGWRAR